MAHWFKELFATRGRVSESVAVGKSNPALELESTCGVNVNADTALSSTAVLGCVRGISETLAMLPLHMYEHRSGGRGSKDFARSHPVYNLVHRRPNPELTSFEWREMAQASTLLHGTSYAEIERDKFGMPINLWPMRSDVVRAERIKDKIVYFVTINGMEHALRSEQVLKIKGFSTYGLLGLNLVDTAQNAIGLAIAQEQSAAKLFENGAIPGGILEHPGKLKPDSRDNLRQSWQSMYGGLTNSHRTAVLEEGMKFHQLVVNPKDSQLLEGRTFQIAEVARIFRYPLHMIQELTRATFSNIEQQSREFVNYTFQPWAERWEQRLDMQLLRPQESNDFFFKFSIDGLLRGDSQARAEFYSKLFNLGAFSINDIRGMEDMNPIGENGDRHFVPVNMAPIENLINQITQQTDDGGEPDA